MKKQYQDIFSANEKEKQKRKRSTHRIPHEGGLTREEAQNLVIPPAEPVEQPVIQPPEPAAPEPAPHSRAPPRCSNCGSHSHKRTRCPNPSSDFGGRLGWVAGSLVDYVTVTDAYEIRSPILRTLVNKSGVSPTSIKPHFFQIDID
ncbi:hypothetical protein AJ79_06278 [Helicocarpus griseus UAMH5409]|uniref:Uncharacterized protein n=1 Tax=Helicocarpus griseus UAMH5409 TaxID=1447875 RepID=A0A2B7XFL3_9EURO|nr:hypothetical protein AJ79_06278 [Helicocarpus griseus UAMH5409]